LIGTVAAVVFRAHLPVGGPPTLAAATGTPFETAATAAFVSGWRHRDAGRGAGRVGAPAGFEPVAAVR
jgi:hypothetical protein